MSAAREIRLVRVPDLRAAHQAIASLACPRADSSASDRIVLVPTRHAAQELGRTLSRLVDPSATFPLLLTRMEFYEELQRRLGVSQPWLGRTERESIFFAASHTLVARGLQPPFALRPRLIAEMLELYDSVRRNQRTVADFERVLVGVLEPGADTDRGAARLLAQTMFLIGVFRSYEQKLLEIDGLDEHRLRAFLLAGPIANPVLHVIQTVADQPAEVDGLWPADFDLLTRLPGLARIDVVATSHALDAGFRERVYESLPGIEEVPWMHPPRDAPSLVVSGPGAPYHVRRDREEELIAVAKSIKAKPSELSDAVVVYARPLPYVYLAKRIFRAAELPFTTADTLPLAAEPYAAALDLVLEAVLTQRAREPMLQLIESPLLTWQADGRRLTPQDVAALRAQSLEDPGTDGDVRLGVSDSTGAWQVLRRARAELEALDADRTLGAHFEAVADLLRRRGRHEGAAEDERHARARAATLDLLDDLGRAYRRHSDRTVSFRDAVPFIRRAIEEHTFDTLAGSTGVRLTDARAAKYAEAGVVWIVGVNEGEWPLPARRNIFYPVGLLRDLGFPRDRDRQPFARASFRDLMFLARSRTAVSVFQLEEDAIVRPSVLVEDLDDLNLTTIAPEGKPAEAFDDILQRGKVGEGWLRIRQKHPEKQAPRFHGHTGPPPARVVSVTQVDRYRECPFKYFASVVLGLEEEETQDVVGIDPRRRGTLVHAVFQAFFKAWEDAGHAAITPALLPEARESLAGIADRFLRDEPDADRLIERVRLLGSAGAPGLGERVFRLEAIRPEPIVERLLEFDLRGVYDFGNERPALVEVKGVADRIDLLADGTMRLIDYKTGRAPHRDRSVQLAVYAICAEQKLAGYRGRRWRIGEAAYLALADPQSWVCVIRHTEDRQPLEEGRKRFLEALGGIAAGVFPPSPSDRRLCITCAFATVCRKEYVGAAA